MNEKPILSVVIPTVGRPILLKAVASLLAADGADRLQIIVSGTIQSPEVYGRLKELMKENPRLEHLSVSFDKGDSSSKKNAGWYAAISEIVAFVDDDVIVGRDWATSILEPFADQSVGLVSGPGLLPSDISLIARLGGLALASRAAGYVAERYAAESNVPKAVKWSRLIGCNMAYRRKILEEIGGFDPGFWPGEEMIAAYIATARKGYKLVFQPKAVLYHYPRAAYFQFLKQMYGYGATRIRLIRAGTDIEPATLAPMVLFALFAVMLAGSFFSKLILMLFAVVLTVYFLFVFWCALLKWREEKDARALLIAFIIPTMHLSYGLAEWVELVSPNRDLSINKNIILL